MEDDSKTELIDRYLDEEMSVEEKISFEGQMSRDPDLKLEVEAQGAVRTLIREQAERNELKNLFNVFQKDLDAQADWKFEKPIVKLGAAGEKKERKIVWGNWSYMAIAASVALAILGVWTVIKQRDQIGDQAEMRTEKGSESFRVPLLTWDNQRFKPTLRKKELIDVTILRSKDYKSHYRFTNTLELYSATLTEKQQKISVAYDLDTRQFTLHIGNKSYLIQKTGAITILPQPR